MLLYTNIDHTLPDKLHGPMHYKLCVTRFMFIWMSKSG